MNYDDIITVYDNLSILNFRYNHNTYEYLAYRLKYNISLKSLKLTGLETRANLVSYRVHIYE